MTRIISQLDELTDDYCNVHSKSTAKRDMRRPYVGGTAPITIAPDGLTRTAQRESRPMDPTWAVPAQLRSAQMEATPREGAALPQMVATSNSQMMKRYQTCNERPGIGALIFGGPLWWLVKARK